MVCEWCTSTIHHLKKKVYLTRYSIVLMNVLFDQLILLAHPGFNESQRM